MRPKPTREWVMQELERLQVRVVSGRSGRLDEIVDNGVTSFNGPDREYGGMYDDPGLSTGNGKIGGSDQKGDSLIAALPTGHDRSAHLSRNSGNRTTGVSRRGSITETLLSVAGAERNMSLGFGSTSGLRDSIGWSTMGAGGDPVMDSLWQQPHRNSSMSLARNLLMQDTYDPYGTTSGRRISQTDHNRNQSTSTTHGSYPPSHQLSSQQSSLYQMDRETGTSDKNSDQNGNDPRNSGSKPQSTSPPIAPPHRPLVGGGSAAAYEAAREEHYRQLAEKKKEEATKKRNATSKSNAVPYAVNNRGEQNSNPNIQQGSSLDRQNYAGNHLLPQTSGLQVHQGSNLMGNVGVNGSGVGAGLSSNARQHYEMLKLHHRNLLNEIHETSMMINLYEQQHIGGNQPIHQQHNANGFNVGSQAMQPMADPMQQLLAQKRINIEQSHHGAGNHQYDISRRFSGPRENFVGMDPHDDIRRAQVNDYINHRRLSDASLGTYGGYMSRGSDVALMKTGAGNNNVPEDSGVYGRPSNRDHGANLHSTGQGSLGTQNRVDIEVNSSKSSSKNKQNSPDTAGSDRNQTESIMRSSVKRELEDVENKSSEGSTEQETNKKQRIAIIEKDSKKNENKTEIIEKEESVTVDL